jgi:hypothetical protein
VERLVEALEREERDVIDHEMRRVVTRDAAALRVLADLHVLLSHPEDRGRGGLRRDQSLAPAIAGGRDAADQEVAPFLASRERERTKRQLRTPLSRGMRSQRLPSRCEVVVDESVDRAVGHRSAHSNGIGSRRLTRPG